MEPVCMNCKNQRRVFEFDELIEIICDKEVYQECQVACTEDYFEPIEK